MDRVSVGKRMRRHRKAMSLTREQFSELVDISPQFLSEIENGTKGISAETLYKVCSKATASADYILLGRQNAGDVKTRAVEILSKIPPEYSESVEEVLQNLSHMIELAEKSGKSENW